MTTASEMDAQAAAASAEQKKKLRRAVAIGVGSVVGTIAFLLVTFWVGSWVSSPATVTNVNTNQQQTLYQQKCGDGKIKENVRVTTAALQINPNPHHCGIRWIVKSGTVQFVGSSVPFGNQTAGSTTGDTRDGMASAVVAIGGNAIIDYQLCPATHRAPGWC